MPVAVVAIAQNSVPVVKMVRDNVTVAEIVRDSVTVARNTKDDHVVVAPMVIHPSHCIGDALNLNFAKELVHRNMHYGGDLVVDRKTAPK